MNNQEGQSLVEFVIVTPLFFIILSGIISLFYLQNRDYIDQEAKISVSISQYLFENEERKIAFWEHAENEKSYALKSVLFNSFNPSSVFKGASDKKVGVFFDKNVVSYFHGKNCSTKNTFGLSLEKEGKFQFSTCSDKNGYERMGFSFAKVLDNFPLSILQHKESSLYYPPEEMSWINRSHLIKNAVQEFTLSAKEISFSKNYASLSFPQDNSLFNGKCFLEPFQPKCILSPYSRKIKRAVNAGSNIQLLACRAEMAAKCALTGPGAPECIVAGVEAIKESMRLGMPAPNCSSANAVIKEVSAFINAKSLTGAMGNTISEGNMRKNFF